LSLTTQDIINNAYEFIENEYRKEIDRKLAKNKRLVIDFRKLAFNAPELAEELLENPEDTLKAFDLALANFDIDGDTKNSKARFKNLPNSCKIPIGELRDIHANKFLMIEGIIKQKGKIRPVMTSARFECPACGAILNVIQLDAAFKEPSRCSCGRKGHFRKISEEKVDAGGIVLEEPAEEAAAVKLAQIKVAFARDLTEPKIDKLLNPGIRIIVIGILKEIQIEKHGVKSTAMDWFLDANYIDIKEESFANISWTSEDINEFKKLARECNCLDILRKNIYKDIFGCEEETEGVLLQMFGGVNRRREGSNARGDIHILLIGDPGGAKSTILKITQKFSPKAIYVAGTGVSGAGITASVVKDEFLGGFSLEAGPLIMANGGICMIDELDKMKDEHKQALHEPLEQQTISIAKAGITATMPALTSVLAAANPKFGSYSEYDSVYSQIELTSTLVNRFDLVYPMKESKLDKNDNYDVAMKVLMREDEEKLQEGELTKEFIRKYIAFAKTLKPHIPHEIRIEMAKRYADIKESKRKTESKDSLPISARNIDALRRLTEATARGRLHDVATREDMIYAYNKLIYSIRQLGVDPSTGEAATMTVLEDGEFKKVTYSPKDISAKMISFIREQSKGGASSSAYHDDIMRAVGEGVDARIIDELLDKLKKKGEIFEPKNGFYKYAG
jgi:replicative DNA helicase Mcm